MTANSSCVTSAEMHDYLSARGWHQWYHQNYWVHPARVADQTKLDYTGSGCSLQEAYAWEQAGRPMTIWGVARRIAQKNATHRTKE